MTTFGPIIMLTSRLHGHNFHICRYRVHYDTVARQVDEWRQFGDQLVGAMVDVENNTFHGIPMTTDDTLALGEWRAEISTIEASTEWPGI